MSGAEAFQAFIAEMGFDPPARIEPGRFFRFPTNGKRGDDAGYGKLFPDGEGGFIGNFRTNETWTWQARRERAWTEQEKSAWRERIERERKAAEAERDRERKAAGYRATDLWQKALPATAEHAYLKSKGIRAHGATIYRGPLAIREMRCDGALMIPLRSPDGQLSSLEFISALGEKRFLPGGAKSGAYFSIGKPSDVLYITEGFATGASVYEATGQAVAVAFDASNLGAAARSLRGKLPEAQIIIAGDHDASGTGRRAAEEAATAVGGLVALPPNQDQDWNDVAQHEGHEAVRKGLAAAKPPDASAQVVAQSPEPQAHSEWPDPIPLPSALPAVARFSFDLLPASLRNWLADATERTQCPPDFMAVGAIVSLGATVGRKVAIRPKLRDDWHEVANLWGGIVGAPGMLKTPALQEAMKPLRRIEAKSLETYENVTLREWEGKREASKIMRDAARHQALKSAKKGEKLESVELGAVDFEEPRAPRRIVTDTTVEALGEVLVGNQNGVLAYRDELIGLLKSLDREGQESARAFYLSAWSGKEGHIIDRVGRGLNIRIEACCVSVLGSIQPAMIGQYLRDAVTNGGDDGLLGRFSLLVWPDLSGEWRNVDRWPDSEARAEAFRLFERLDSLDPAAVGAASDNPDELPFLRLDEEARELFVEWHTGLEKRLRSEDDHAALQVHISKYRKAVPSLALLLHLANGGSGSITIKPVLQALAWAEYLETHARRAYSSVMLARADSARALLAKIRRRAVASAFALRDVYRNGWAGLSSYEMVREAADMLVEHDYLAESRTQPGPAGGASRTLYVVNPKAMRQ